MTDRFRTDRGMYTAFDHSIHLRAGSDASVLYHEFYHHLQNISSAAGAERLNLLVQFLAHATKLAAACDTLHLPLNQWYTTATEDDSAKPHLYNIVMHQDEWLYILKNLYPPLLISDDEKVDEHLATHWNAEKEAEEPYLTRWENNQLRGYPVGQWTIAESGAYALELWRAARFKADVLKHFQADNYPYLLLLEWTHRLIPDFRLACLATFLLCDLCMTISTPSAGFLALYPVARLFFAQPQTEKKLLDWYARCMEFYQEQIDLVVQLEKEMMHEIRRNQQGLDTALDAALNWQLDHLERGLHWRQEGRLELVHTLLYGSVDDFKTLIKHFPPTLIQDDNTHQIYYDDPAVVEIYDVLKTAGTLMLTTCRDADGFLDLAQQHLHRKGAGVYQVAIQSDEKGETDALGYLLHTLGWDGKLISLAQGQLFGQTKSPRMPE